MKKIRSLPVNLEKVINNEGLINLRGGNPIEGCPCYVSCKVEGNHCGGFWTDNCNDPNNFWRCHLIPACINSDAYVCV